MRLRGNYHNGNEKQIPTDLVTSLTQIPKKRFLSGLTRRENA